MPERSNADRSVIAACAEFPRIDLAVAVPVGSLETPLAVFQNLGLANLTVLVRINLGEAGLFTFLPAFLRVRAEVPGVEPKDFDISVSGDVLSISGEKKEESEERRGNVYRSERRFGSFRRHVRLPEAVDTDKIEAEYDKGILTIRLAKSEKVVGRRIPVSLKK